MVTQPSPGRPVRPPVTGIHLQGPGFAGTVSAQRVVPGFERLVRSVSCGGGLRTPRVMVVGIVGPDPDSELLAVCRTFKGFRFTGTTDIFLI